MAAGKPSNKVAFNQRASNLAACIPKISMIINRPKPSGSHKSAQVRRGGGPSPAGFPEFRMNAVSKPRPREMVLDRICRDGEVCNVYSGSTGVPALRPVLGRNKQAATRASGYSTKLLKSTG